MFIFITVYDSFVGEELKISMKNVLRFEKNFEDDTYSIIYQINTGRIIKETFDNEVNRDIKYSELETYKF